MKVSAVLPVYNSQNTLERAIYSLLKQPEIDQILLVEDGSIDKSLELCEKFAKSYDIITLLRHPNGENKGAPASRNLGMNQVKNSWVQFMDADDELKLGKIANQLAHVDDSKALIVGKFTYYSPDSTEKVNPSKDMWSGLISTRLGISSSNLWNADVVRQVGGWNESLLNLQEYYLMFEILKYKAEIAYADKNLTNVFSQPNSITNSPKNKNIKRDNYFVFRNQLKQYLISIGEFTLRRKHYYEVCTGKMLRYHQPPFHVEFNKSYFLLYNLVKKVSENS